MSTTPTQVPVTITPEARVYVAELGMQAEFEQMLEHTLQSIADLRALHVSLMRPYEEDDVPCVVFDVQLTQEAPLLDGTWDRWSEWFRRTFPQKAVGRFELLSTPPGPDHAG